MKILLFFMAVFMLLLGIALVFPQDGIRLGSEAKLRFTSVGDLFGGGEQVATGYTDSLIAQAVVSDDPEWIGEGALVLADGQGTVPGGLNGALDHSVSRPDTLSLVPVADTAWLQARLDSLVKIRIDSIRERVFPIAFSERATKEFTSFLYAAGRAVDSGRVLRVLHYGDSQIENDRMTALLRYRLQRIFGGSGVGMVPAIPLYSGNPAFTQAIDGDWTRYTGFGKRDTTLGHASYGTMACFTAVPLPEEGWLPSLEFEFRQGRRASDFRRLRIFMHACADSGFVAIRLNDTIADTVLHVTGGYQELSVDLPVVPSKVRLEFGLVEGGRIYGISFDPLSGVQVDNIAMRGSSGLELSRLDRQVMDTMLKALDPGLIIMQFGGNMVPYVKNTSFYKRALKRELKYLKGLCPDIPVLVIGPSDMSVRRDGRYTTYETLEPVRDAMREAALESGCAFWDMYEAMGGAQSIRNFVLADPPLARPDHIHFTPRGANLVAGMVFEAMAVEVE